MAVIQTPKASASANFGDQPPKGTYLAVCLDVIDEYDVINPYTRNDEVPQKWDQTRFVFGVKTKDGKFLKIPTKAERISGSEKSNIYRILTSWNGEPPKDNFDTKTMVGKPAQITVIEKPNRDGTKMFSNISAIGPVMEELLPKVPKVSDFGGNDNSGEEIPF